MKAQFKTMYRLIRTAKDDDRRCRILARNLPIFFPCKRDQDRMFAYLNTRFMLFPYGTGDYQDYLCKADQARFDEWTETAKHESRFYAGCGIDIVCKVV